MYLLKDMHLNKKSNEIKAINEVKTIEKYKNLIHIVIQQLNQVFECYRFLFNIL